MTNEEREALVAETVTTLKGLLESTILGWADERRRIASVFDQIGYPALGNELRSQADDLERQWRANNG